MDGSRPPRIQRMQHDSALGRWFIDLCAPCPALAPHVDALWYGEGGVAYERDRILPNGGAFLLVNLGPPQYRIEAGPPERRVTFDDIWYSGPHRGPIDTEAPHGNAILGVALKPCGSHAWLGVAAAEVADRTLALGDIVGDSARALRERLLQCRDSATRFALTEDWLVQRLRVHRGTHPVVQWALGRIEASRGQVAIDGLAREAGYTRKHLATLFAEQVGLAPKAIARLQRFRAALQMLEGREQVPWAELAARCGYFDQAHLSRDFRAFCGFAPGEFVRHARADARSIVLR